MYSEQLCAIRSPPTLRFAVHEAHYHAIYVHQVIGHKWQEYAVTLECPVPRQPCEPPAHGYTLLEGGMGAIDIDAILEHKINYKTNLSVLKLSDKHILFKGIMPDRMENWL